METLKKVVDFLNERELPKLKFGFEFENEDEDDYKSYVKEFNSFKEFEDYLRDEYGIVDGEEDIYGNIFRLDYGSFEYDGDVWKLEVFRIEE
jgi:hypothetical protein